LADILRAAQDPKAFRVALNLSETILGKPGVDLIWDLWEDEKYLPDHKEQTDKLAKKLVILSRRATPALRVAIDLTFTNQCDKLLGILARAATEADTRSVARLTELGSKVGCGAGQAEDCYACLRDDPLLGQALEKAKKTPAPALGQTIDD